MSGILPDCTRCGGHVRLDLDPDGPVEVCQGCGLTARPIPARLTRAARSEIRAQVAQVRRTRPLLCPSCLDRRCRSCHVVRCECPGNHPRRPAGDLTPEGSALLAGERSGHLEPAELTASTR